MDTFQAVLDSSLPVCLSQIFKPEYLNMNYCELLTVASDYQITVTEQQSLLVEFKTKEQAQSKLWYADVCWENYCVTL